MKVIVTGATGYVGEGVLLECLNNPEIEKVLSVSRKPCGHVHPKLEEYLVPDFMKLETGDEKLMGYDAVFFCAGISSVGVKEDVYKVIRLLMYWWEQSFCLSPLWLYSTSATLKKWKASSVKFSDYATNWRSRSYM